MKPTDSMIQPLQIRSGDESNLLEQARALLSGQHDLIANAANLSALLFYGLQQINWVGFYFLKGGELVVGPFQGKPACVTIPLGQGVCGTAAKSRQIQRVADVHAFDGHIACDIESRSELVIPLLSGDRLLGVLDLDSPVLDRFRAKDERLLAAIADLLVGSSDWPGAGS
jgi:L-methionine (R)-S-oxide reductase